MSKNIAISNEVYEKLKREKDGKSFSEVIDEKIDSGGKISEVAGTNILDRETLEEVKESVTDGSKGSIKRSKDEVA